MTFEEELQARIDYHRRMLEALELIQQQESSSIPPEEPSAEEKFPETSPHPRCEHPYCEEAEFPGVATCGTCCRLRTEDQ